jgi:D-alanyl-D-alanine carboxypeptidase
VTFLRRCCFLSVLLLIAASAPIFVSLAHAQNGEEDGEETGEVAPEQTQPGTKPKKQAAKKIEIRAPYILIDAKSGEVLAEERSGEPWYPASLSKLMTAYVVFHKIREGSLRLDQELAVSELASSQEPSKIGVPAGKTVSLDFALQALLIYSANDMAYVLAEGASGSIAAFAKEMNAAARRLGLSASHFENPNGLFDPRQITSARDMAVLSAVIIAEFPEHAGYFKQQFVAVGKRKLPNRNRLVRTMAEADGMKTGFVCASGFNLVASATQEGRRLVAVVMGYKNGFSRAEAAQALLLQGFDKAPNPSGQKVAEVVNLPQGAIVPTDMTPVVCKNKAPFLIKDGTHLSGWAVSFGTYDSGQKADMALRGRLLSPAAVDVKGSAGVIRLPEKNGYGAWFWGHTQATAESLCQTYRIDGAHCEIVTPDVLENMAVEAKRRQVAELNAGMEEGDGSLIASKSRRSAKRRFAH